MSCYICGLCGFVLLEEEKNLLSSASEGKRAGAHMVRRQERLLANGEKA